MIVNKPLLTLILGAWLLSNGQDLYESIQQGDWRDMLQQLCNFIISLLLTLYFVNGTIPFVKLGVNANP